jgi:arylsulfatase A-like enzyme
MSVPDPTQARKPNLVIFNPDQWRGDVLGHLGNPGALTPNLDQLVRTEAVSFRNTFCQNPVCTPSRCSFMTGWYPHTHGHRTMHYMLQPDEPNLLQVLKAAGYTVWWGGKNDLFPGQNSLERYCDIRNPDPDPASFPVYMNLHAYDSWRGKPEADGFFSFYSGKLEKQAETDEFAYDADWHHVLGAVSFIREAQDDQPFCLYLPLGFPHPPYAVEDPWYSQIERERVPKRIPSLQDWSKKPSILRGIYEHQHLGSWSEARWKELRATYYGMCSRVDAQLGMLLQALREAGLYEDTAVFFFADHGDFTGDYGLVEKTQNTFEDCLTHVPLVIKPPGSFHTQPGIRQALVELVDFPATVYDLLDLDPGYTHFGRSLAPLLAGDQWEHRQAVFCEGGRIRGEIEAMEPMPEQNLEQWLYYPRVHLQHSEGPEHTKAVMCRSKEYKYVHRLYEMDELYDLGSDPCEVDNRIDDPALAPIKGEFQERLLRFFMETGDIVPHQLDMRW